jgi:Zn finger protein HypA/HybF involved in hydrogenase expression
MTIDKQALRKELSNPAIGSNSHLRKLALALLDELEAAEKRGADMEVACELYAESKLEQIKMEAALEKARQRIAELEARDKPKFVQCWSCKHNIEILAIADCDGYCPRCAAPIDLDDEPYIGTAAAGKGE